MATAKAGAARKAVLPSSMRFEADLWEIAKDLGSRVVAPAVWAVARSLWNRRQPRTPPPQTAAFSARGGSSTVTIRATTVWTE